MARIFLAGGWTNPSEKYARQIGSFPQVGMKIENIWNHHLNSNPSKFRPAFMADWAGVSVLGLGLLVELAVMARWPSDWGSFDFPSLEKKGKAAFIKKKG